MEIERKFLVKEHPYRAVVRPVKIVQGYLNSDKQRTVRLRISGDQAWITIKSITIGISRQEFEYAIPVNDGREMLALCEQPLMEKDRFVFEENGLKWEVDEFRGGNEGLIIAEIELSEPTTEIPIPSWVGEEVSHDARFFNSNLCKNPFSSWKPDSV